MKFTILLKSEDTPATPLTLVEIDRIDAPTAATLGLTVAESKQLLALHECRQVQQYEALGSIENFLTVYLKQLAEVGYQDAPLEIDASAHERVMNVSDHTWRPR